MTPVKQSVKHDPANGRYGDCMRCCIASMLDMQPAGIRNFGELASKGAEEFWSAVNDFLIFLGYRIATFAFDAEVPEVLASMELHNSGMYWIMGCAGPKANHSVVCCGGRVVSDPAGYTVDQLKRDDSGFVWANLLYPLRFFDGRG